MSAGFKVEAFAYSARFKAEFRGLPPDVLQACQAALQMLLDNPRANSLRLHNLSGYKKPTIWKIDVYANHAWQVTFEMNGSTAELKRVATHRDIDRNPRG